ncbi:MAG: DUF481 domain-containing protein [Flavobacteriia bacterium]|jgi:hypothetical protein
MCLKFLVEAISNLPLYRGKKGENKKFIPKISLSILLTFFLFNKNFSQIVNIENKRIYDDTTGWSGALDATFSYIQNKDFIYNLNAKGRIQYKTRKHYFFLLNDFFYSGGKTVYANSGMSHFRYSYRIKNSTWKWESYAQIQYNQLLNQKSRSLIGTGLRDKIIDKKNIKAFLGTSLFYEYEEIQPNNEFNTSFRWSSYLSWFMNFKHFSFSGTTYYQPNIEDFSDFRFAGQYAFNTQISKKIRFKMDLNVFHDSKPPENVRHTIGSFLVGVGYDFGK